MAKKTTPPPIKGGAAKGGAVKASHPAPARATTTAARPGRNGPAAPAAPAHDPDEEIPIGGGIIAGTGAPGPKTGRFDPVAGPAHRDDDTERDDRDDDEPEPDDDDDDEFDPEPTGEPGEPDPDPDPDPDFERLGGPGGVSEELPIMATGEGAREQGRGLAVAYVAALDMLDQRAADYWNWLSARGIKGARRWHRIADGTGDERHFRAGRKGKIIEKGATPDVEIID